MTGIYRRALGDDFDRLHPRLRERYDLASDGTRAMVGRGRMRRVWSRPLARPALRLAARRNLPFPETGEDVPFTVENVAYRDRFGREAVAWTRAFETAPPRRFDATMVYGEERDCVVDYLGRYADVVSDLHLSVTADRGLHVRGRDARLLPGRLGVAIPRPLAVHADVFESYDDAAARVEVEVTVHSPTLGRLFGYEGWFEPTFPPPGDVPRVRPAREVRAE